MDEKVLHFKVMWHMIEENKKKVPTLHIKWGYIMLFQHYYFYMHFFPLEVCDDSLHNLVLIRVFAR